MVELDLKEGIELEVLETDSVSEAECGSGACGCGCGSEQQQSDQLVLVAGASDTCCEPGCSPETCGNP